MELNVGGTHDITTAKRTLMKFEGTALEAMFSGRHELTKFKGKIFIDRDGEAFADMISYLRNGRKPPFDDNHSNDQNMIHFRGRYVSQRERSFYRELDYWQIPPPERFVSMGQDDLLHYRNYQFNEFDPDWVAPTLKLEGPTNNIVKKKHTSHEHGIVYCKYPLNF